MPRAKTSSPRWSRRSKGLDLGGVAGATRARRRPERARTRPRCSAGASAPRCPRSPASWRAVRSALDAFTHDALQKLARAVEGDLERGAHGESFRRTHAAVQRAAGAFEGGAGRLRTELAAAERTTSEEGRTLAAAHAKEDDAYQTLVFQDDADRERAAQSERLHTQVRGVVARRQAPRPIADAKRGRGAKKGPRCSPR